ncbi:MAG TPA: peptidylprolyl isomerase, partial [Nitrospirota bacterium]|nr:peptidylprolyl isomerase [Nitrospirota bacterium]
KTATGEAQKPAVGGKSTAPKTAPEDAQKPTVSGKGTASNTTPEEAQINLRVPVWSSRFSQFPVALVNDDPITLEDVTKNLVSTHAERGDDKKQTGKIDYSKILDRLINVRLAVQEAINIGFDELPEFKSAMDQYSRATLAVLARDEIAKDVQADPAAVEKAYKEAVTEWKISSFLFEKEDDAKSVADAVKAGKSFDELAQKAIAEKKAKAGEQGTYIKPRELQPDIEKRLATMEVGSVSPVLKFESGKVHGFTIIRLEDKRTPENAGARKWAEQAVLAVNKAAAVNEYKQKLYKQYVTIRERLLDGLNLDSPKTKIQELLTDTRVIAEVKDEKPVTVGALMLALNDKHYHGLARAAEEKKLNQEKGPVLHELIDKLVLHQEALRRGLDKGADYQYAINEFKASTLFGLFIERVIYPDFKLKDEDVKAYYQAHKGEFMRREKMRITSFAFGNRKDAESALAKLRKGDDINWVRANAEGLVTDSSESIFSLYEGRDLDAGEMPENLRQAVAGARKGDFRLYASSDGLFYVLAIAAVTPPQQKPFEEVSGLIEKTIFSDKFNQAVEDWFVKLRAASDVKVYLSGYPAGTRK